MSEYFSSLLTMQKWSSKHIKKKKTPRVREPHQGKLARPMEPHQAGYSVSPASLQGRDEPRPTPASTPPSPLSSQHSCPAETPALVPSPSCNNLGSLSPAQVPRPALYTSIYYITISPSCSSFLWKSETWSGHDLGRTVSSSTPIPLLPSSWTLDPHGWGHTVGPGTGKSVAPARSVRHPRDLPLCGLHHRPCTCPQGE